MEPIGHVPHVVGEFLQPLHGMSNPEMRILRRSRDSPVDLLQLQQQEGQALIHVIVQIPRDASSLLFLRGQDPAGQHMQLLLAALQRHPVGRQIDGPCLDATLQPLIYFLQQGLYVATLIHKQHRSPNPEKAEEMIHPLKPGRKARHTRAKRHRDSRQQGTSGGGYDGQPAILTGGREQYHGTVQHRVGHPQRQMQVQDKEDARQQTGQPDHHMLSSLRQGLG